MMYRVEVRGKGDPPSVRLGAALGQQGIPVASARLHRVYLLEGASLDLRLLTTEGRRLLADPVCEEAEISQASDTPPLAPGRHVVLVFKRPGVMDPVEATALEALADAGLKVERFRAGDKYVIESSASLAQVVRAVQSFANEVVDEVVPGERAFATLSLDRKVAQSKRAVPLREASDTALAELSRTMALSLDLDEMRAVQRYFRGEGREPTDCELETIAQTWSEHCKHKTFRSDVALEGTVRRDLLRSTVMKATEELSLPWCLSVFKDNAGVVDFDETHAVCFKVETHNHPSAIEPYGGANTGLGGVIRDILGCGLGAEPVASVDVFAVGPPDMPAETLPPGVIHPKRLLEKVVAGVRDYGNRMGIPTVAGAVLVDERFAANPLVFCGTVGLLPKNRVAKEARAGDLIALVGGRTGRDGIHGATFSSASLDSGSGAVSRSAVQIGNAIVEKKVLDAVLEARDLALFRHITDCGAGGLSSAVGEMAEPVGCEVRLEAVPLKYEGLTYAEIWISEAQERMVLAVPPENLDRLRQVCGKHDVELTVIGGFGGPRRLRLKYGPEQVCDLDMEFLHRGIPRRVLQAARPAPEGLVRTSAPADLGSKLLELLGHPDVASKEWIIRQYDHEVRGGTVVKPLVGASADGPSDAAVLRPKLDSELGLAIGLGIAPRIQDPDRMAAGAIDEALRNVVAVGGDPSRTSLLDNFCWPSPDDPESLGALVLAAEACCRSARALGTPFISGKDSFNNQYRWGERVIRIPYTLLISALSIVPDVRRAVTMDLKAAGNAIVIAGWTKPEFWFSAPGPAPTVDAGAARLLFLRVHEAIRSGLVRSCHDLSEGGLGVALAEAAMAGALGMDVALDSVPGESKLAHEILFSESQTRFLIETPNPAALGKILGESPHAVIGRVTDGERLVVSHGSRTLVDEKLSTLSAAWKGAWKER